MLKALTLLSLLAKRCVFWQIHSQWRRGVACFGLEGRAFMQIHHVYNLGACSALLRTCLLCSSLIWSMMSEEAPVVMVGNFLSKSCSLSLSQCRSRTATGLQCAPLAAWAWLACMTWVHGVLHNSARLNISHQAKMRTINCYYRSNCRRRTARIAPACCGFGVNDASGLTETMQISASSTWFMWPLGSLIL